MHKVMRIIGGIWKGKPLAAPRGGSTRPTTDRTREAVVSAISSYFSLDLSGLSVLDGFAGSGAMGLELLSRGASHTTFCDIDRHAISCIQKNLAALRVPASAVFLCCLDMLAVLAAADASTAQGLPGSAAALSLPGAPFDVVYLDPPYKTGMQEVFSLLGRLAKAKALTSDALVVFEHAKASAVDPTDLPGGFMPIKSKKYAKTQVDYFAFQPSASPEPSSLKVSKTQFSEEAHHV